MIYIIKRDGRKVQFNKRKIENAICKCFTAVDGELSDYGESKSISIANYIESKVNEDSSKEFTVEEIQDMVENGLMNTRRKDVARAYIKYRNERTKIREKNSDLMIEVGKKISASDVQNQNANMDEKSFGGRMGEARNILTKKYALDFIISEKVKRNHINNRIYIHDLDNYAVGTHNCLTIPFDDILAKGFNTRQTDVRPANSVNTAFQLVAVIFQLQSLQQFGGVSASHIDHTMVPYVRKSFMKHYIAAYLKDKEDFLDLNLEDMIFDTYDERIENGLYVTRNKFDDWVDENKEKFLEDTGLCIDDFKFENEDRLNHKYYQQAMYDTIIETQQAVEGMYHNLNTLQSRSGNQLPFTSINFGTCTSKEGRLVIKALLSGSIKGVGRLHRTSVFPCTIFQCMKGVNRKPGDINYDLFKLAIKSTSKRLYPNYCNVDWSVNAGYDINNPSTYTSTMGKRKLSSCKTF